jgi:predicted nucleotidyltransferase
VSRQDPTSDELNRDKRQAMNEGNVSPGILEEIVDRLAQGLHPEQIYLFGSQTRDQAAAGSDIDLLVVVPDSDLPRHRREALSYDLLWGLKTPVDLIVLTQAEFQRASRVKTSLASTVKAEGMVVHG